MMDHISLFNRVLEKYRFTEPLPKRAQEHIRLNKSRQFKRTLKRAGRYSILTGAVSSLFFMLRRYGLNISYYGSAVITALAALLIVSSLAVSIVFTVLNTFHQSESRNSNGEDGGLYLDNSHVITEADTFSSQKKGDMSAAAVSRYGIQPFISENVSSQLALSISDVISDELSGFLGDERVINLRKGRKGKEIGMMVMGSVENFDGEYVINVRISSVKDSRILFYTSQSFKRKNEYRKACRSIAQAINNSLK